TCSETKAAHTDLHESSPGPLCTCSETKAAQTCMSLPQVRCARVQRLKQHRPACVFPSSAVHVFRD
ncbi:hypothetical protein LEMLEM_LOCUS15581, partial [Lemmus lemmus]